MPDGLPRDPYPSYPDPDPPTQRALPAYQTERSDGSTWLVLGDDPNDGTGEWIACDAAQAVSGSDAQ